MVDTTAEKYVCEACGHYETPRTVICQDWDKCESCGGQLVRNPDFIQREACIFIGGDHNPRAKHPKEIQNELGKHLRRQKQDILRGKGSVVERDQAIQKLIFENRTEEIRQGALDIKVPRLLDSGLKPDIPTKFHAVGSIAQPKKQSSQATSS